MNKEQAETLLAQLIFDELDEPTKTDLLAYLETDAELREQLGDMRLTANLLRDGAAEAEGQPQLSHRRRAQMLRRAERAERARDARRLRFAKPSGPAMYRYARYAAAAVIVMALFVTALMLPGLAEHAELAEHKAQPVVAQSDHDYVSHANDPHQNEGIAEPPSRPGSESSVWRENEAATTPAHRGGLGYDELVIDPDGLPEADYREGRSQRASQTELIDQPHDKAEHTPGSPDLPDVTGGNVDSTFTIDGLTDVRGIDRERARRGGVNGLTEKAPDHRKPTDPAVAAPGEPKESPTEALAVSGSGAAANNVNASGGDESSLSLAGVADDALGGKLDSSTFKGHNRTTDRSDATRIDEDRPVVTGQPPHAVYDDDAELTKSRVNAPLPPASHFKQYPVNGWEMTQADNQSTFAIDTDAASYHLSARYIRNGYLPPRGAVRMEEFINAFDYNYARTNDQTFTINVDAAPNPFARSGEQTVLLKIGVQGKVIGREGRKPAHIVYVVDNSGSMDRKDRLPLAKQAIVGLNGNLMADDNVSLVTYGERAQVQVENTAAHNAEKVNERVNSIQTAGSTNLIDGIVAGYQVAARHYQPDRFNRVILISDGAANVGEDDAKAILSKVDEYRRQGIQLTTAGVGLGGYNDELLEQLANNGDGNYLFLDSAEQVEKQFVRNMDANLQTIARDAKIQVAFDPARVRRYRLIGYENRDIADRDFRNDSVDAGEVGSGQSATALYELELNGDVRAGAELPAIGTVYVRYRNPDTHEVQEINRRIGNEVVREMPVSSRPRFYLAAAVAQFAEQLRDSPHASHADLNDVLRITDQVSRELPLDPQIKELRDLIREARNLSRAP